MDKIVVNLFGIPEIKKNKKKISFPFKKAEALFYYLLINKRTTRNEIIGLLWGDISENSARSNLRNSLYVIRKVFDMDIIKPDQNQIITIDENVNITTDVDVFITDENDIEIYKGQLLQDFYIKDCGEYEEWLINEREYYCKIYRDRLYKRLEEPFEKNRIICKEEYCKLLINTDKFDEEPYRLLMEIYANYRQFNLAISLYQKLVNILINELGIEPDIKTKDTYEKILKLKNLEEENVNISQKKFFYGREKEIDYLLENFASFKKNLLYSNILLTGEAGIGKTKLMDKFLNQINLSEVYLFHVDCYYDEKECNLKPWNVIIKSIFNLIKNEKKIHIPQLLKNNIVQVFPFLDDESDFLEINSLGIINDINYQVIEETLCNIINILFNNKKIIFVFDDMQWIDKISLNLIKGILLNDLENNIIFLGITREEYNYDLEKFITLLNRYNKLEIINLSRFSKNETFEFIDNCLTNNNLSEELKKKIFYETEGNTCFIVEFLNCIKEKVYCDFTSASIDNLIKSRFLNISQEERKVLNVISLFFDGIGMELLVKLTDFELFELIDIIEELKNKNVIEEKLDDNIIIFKYTHKILRKYIYDSLSMIRRKILHEKAGNALEEQLIYKQSDILLYPKIIYNYSRSENDFKVLKYILKNANIYLEYNLDLFPKCGMYEFSKELILDIENIIPYFKELEDRITLIEMHMSNTDEILELKANLYLIKGRYLIRVGEYYEGVQSINKVIECCKEIKNDEYLLLATKQLIYYSIQVNDIELMEEEIENAFKICYRIELDSEKAVLLRLKGLNRIMKSDFIEANKLLKESINLFEKLNLKQNIYSVNIAAAYNYIGDINRLNNNFDEAIVYYFKAINICKGKGVIRGVSNFYTNAGRCAIDGNRNEIGIDYLEKALNYYAITNELSGKAIAYSLMAYIKVKEENYKSALLLLLDADLSVHIQNKAIELGIFRKIQAIIKIQMDNNSKLEEIFSPHLNENSEFYIDEAIKHFNKVNENYEIKFLKELKTKLINKSKSSN